jgi:hypothetical protein
MAEYRTSAYASVGAVDEDAIKKYIENQKCAVILKP